MDTPKAFARIGIVYLEEAILTALGDEALMPSQISKRLNILGYAEGKTHERYKIVRGILQRLANDGRVERHHQGHRWKRTDIEVVEENT